MAGATVEGERMETGRRVRVLGDLFHGRLPDGAAGRSAVYVGRGAPGLRASPFANPHPAGGRSCRHCAVVHSSDDAVAAYARHLGARPELVAAARVQLANVDLACWCPPDRRCHADVLLLVAAGTDPAATLHRLGLPTAA